MWGRVGTEDELERISASRGDGGQEVVSGELDGLVLVLTLSIAAKGGRRNIALTVSTDPPSAA